MTAITTWTLIIVMVVQNGYSGFTVTNLKDKNQCENLVNSLHKELDWRNDFSRDYTQCVPTVEYVK